MIKILLLIILIFFFQGCATWSGLKQDSKQAWEVTKGTSNEVLHSVKKSIHEATSE